MESATVKAPKDLFGCVDREELLEENLLYANGLWIPFEEMIPEVEEFESPVEEVPHEDQFKKLFFDGIDGEEFMGTGTAFDTDEAPPVYTPAGS